MATRVNFALPFTKDLDRLERRFPQVVDEVENLVLQVRSGERPGDKIPHVGYDVRKVRLANPSAGRGKSGGFRVVYYLQQADSVLMLTIYTKTEKSDITADQIRRIIEDYAG